MLEEKKSEFLKLFQEFAETYLQMPQGQLHISHYKEESSEARKNLESILEAQKQGKDVTEDVLLKLLPYAGTGSNQEKSCWISIAPTFNCDVRTKFEAVGWATKEDWPMIAEKILNFLRRCYENPEQLFAACEEFSASPYSKGFQAGTLTPILHALRPDDFILINNKSRRVYNYFSGTTYTSNLLDYNSINNTARKFINEINDEIHRFIPGSIRNDDFFDMFAHWLVAIKKYNFGSRTHYWKIAPGENAWNWNGWVNGGFIAIGWNDLGDVSQLSRSEFEAQRDELLATHKDWDKVGTEQVWKFARIREGDRILANRGTSEVLGVGTVVGPSYFASDETYGHRIPVEWEDFAMKKINKPGWRKTLIELSQEDFEKIYNLPESIDIYRIFKDKDEAEWALNLLKETLKRLGINGPMDERFAITCPSGGKALHLDFGKWLIFGFNNKDSGQNRIQIALLADQKILDEKFESFEFAAEENEVNMKIFKLPIELLKPFGGELQSLYERSLEHIVKKFGGWQSTPWRKEHHIQEIADALFDNTKLRNLLDQKSMGKVWWVNQGSTIDEEKHGYLWAPIRTNKGRSFYHWDNLLEVKENDIILNYANGYLSYVSKVLSPAERSKNPHPSKQADWPEDGNLVRVRCNELTPPIPLNKFSQSVSRLDIEHGPFNSNGGINQGYLFRLTPEALDIIQNSQKETVWPEFARISSGRPAWIFQSNPKFYDIDGALKALTEMTWLVNQYKNEIRAGDTVYIWKSGEEGGILAVGTIITDPAIMTMEEKMDNFVIDRTKFEGDSLRVRLHIDHILPQRVERKDLQNHPVLSSMEIIRFYNATNFKVKPEHAKVLYDFILGNAPDTEINPEYDLDQFSEDTGLELNILEMWVRAIERKRQVCSPEIISHGF